MKNTFINMTPNALLVADKKEVLNLFSDAKLDAEYHRRKKMFKEDIFIYGKKR
ncbi:MAG: hypothetical protein V1729_05350 [Candidatus Woesearchaeota archaeon]